MPFVQSVRGTYGPQSKAQVAFGAQVDRSFYPIADINVGTEPSPSITFNNIPQEFYHLQIIAIFRSDDPDINDTFMTFNDSTSSYYAMHQFKGDGTSASTANFASQSKPGMILFPYSSVTNTYSVAIIDIYDYASTSKAKTVKVMSGFESNGSGQISLRSGLWSPSPAQAITKISIVPSGVYNFVSGTSFSLYGMGPRS